MENNIQDWLLVIIIIIWMVTNLLLQWRPALVTTITNHQFQTHCTSKYLMPLVGRKQNSIIQIEQLSHQIYATHQGKTRVPNANTGNFNDTNLPLRLRMVLTFVAVHTFFQAWGMVTGTCLLRWNWWNQVHCMLPSVWLKWKQNFLPSPNQLHMY